MKAIVRVFLVFALLVLGTTTYAQFNRSTPNVFDFGDSISAFLLAFEDSFQRDYHYKVLPDHAPSTRDAPRSGTMIVLGLGMVGLASWGRKKYRK